MPDDKVDEAQLERDLKLIAGIRAIAWQRSPANLLALLDRLRVMLLIEDITRRQRRVYRTIIDYLEDVLEERLEKHEKADRAQARRTASAYLRDLLKSLED